LFFPFGQNLFRAEAALGEDGADGLGLAEDDVEDEAIDGVVLAIKHGGTDFGGLLAETVHAAFTLFVTGRIPREVVMNDGGEEVLEVDTFR
jgi:hypothetical protein